MKRLLIQEALCNTLVHILDFAYNGEAPISLLPSAGLTTSVIQIIKRKKWTEYLSFRWLCVRAVIYCIYVPLICGDGLKRLQAKRLSD
jgi:hypothetical protein